MSDCIEQMIDVVTELETDDIVFVEMMKNEIKRYRDNPAKYLSELMGVKLSLWQKIWFTSYCK